MLKKSLMIGAVAILALVAFSAVMISDDSEARVVGNSISIEVMKEDGTGSGQYLKYDLVADTSDYYIDTGAHEEVYLAFLSNSNQSFDVTQVNDEGILKIPSEVKYGGDTYKVVGIRNNAFKANENGATPETSPLKNITKVVFPETMVVIGVYVSGSDYLPDDRDFSSSPGGYCFSKCLGLKEVVFPEGSKLKFISVGAFQNTPLESLDLSNCKEGVAVRQRTISDDGTITGYEMSLKSVDLSTVTSLESRAFRNCSTIENIVMPADLGATIADDAFPNMTFCDENGDPITSGAELAGKAFKKNSDGKMVPGHVATFITNGGSEPVEKVYFATNDLPGKDIVKRDGVTFYQWRDASNNPYTEMPDEDITLYAYYYMDVPPIADSITYDGNSHTPYNDTDKYTVSGQITGTNAGDYSVTFAPNDPYTVWKDGSEYKESYDRTWSINKETLNITINANKTYNGSALEYNIQTGDASGLVYGDSITAGALITVSANVKNYTVQTTDWIFTAELATAKGASNYNVTYTVSLEINKADSHIDVTGSQTFTYDGSAPDIATENKTGDGAVTFQYYADDTTPTPLADAPVNAGTYYVVAIVAETENYNSYTSARVPYTINKAKITVSGITAENRAYNGDVNATLISTSANLTGKIDGDDLSVTATGVFADKNVADGKTVTITGLTLDGAAKGNYILAASGQQETTTANITPAEITVSGITAQNRDYNGDVNATLIFTTATLTGKIDGDDLTVTATGVFADKNVADGKTVTITGLTLDGVAKGNYKLAASGQQTETTANITPVEITVSGITAQNRDYNGNTEASLIFTTATLTGMIAGDDLTVTATGTFSDKKVGDGKTVTITGLTLTGDDAGNYKLAASGQQETTTANITPVEITVSGITAQNRAYNRDVDAALIFTTATLTGKIDGDDLTVTATGAFADKKVGDGKTVTISGLALTGNDAGNYVLAASGQQETTTANITPVEITVSGITAENKTYNGNKEAVLNYGSATLNGVLPGDEVTFVSATGVFADKNVGDGKSVTIGDYVLDGADKGNYVLTSQSMTATADITPATITVSGITASDKVFDGNASATLDKSGMVLDGKIGDDDIVIGASGEFVDKNVGSEKIVNIALRLEGADAGNYVLASDTATATASITPAAITGDIEQEGSLIYDGTAQVADVYSTLKSVADEPITVKYSTSRTGEYSSEVPAFTSVGKYTVYYTAEAPNHEVKTGSFTVTISESHNPDIEGGDRVLLSVIAGIAVIAAAMLVGPFLSGRH